MSSGRFDDMLLMVAQESGSIQNLLLDFFGFLKRRTDFFVLSKPGDRIGFPPGACEKMIIAAYNKYREEYLKEHPYTPPPEASQAPPQAAEVPESQPEPPKAVPLPDYGEEVLNKPIREEQPVSIEPKAHSSSVEISTDNGAATERYLWSQDIKDVTVQIKLNPGTRARDLFVQFQAAHITVAYKSDPENPLLKGELFDKIHPDLSFWQLDEGTIVLNMEKAKDTVWNTVIKGDAEIDPQKVDMARRVDEYDEDTQVGIRKVMYENERKMRGLPTTDEEKAQEAMKKYWENSPYKDQPFDPSLLMQGPPQE